MSNLERYSAGGSLSHKSTPTGIINRYQLSKALDQAAVDKQLALSDAEKKAIVSQLEAQLIREKIQQDAFNMMELARYVRMFLENHMTGVSTFGSLARHLVEQDPSTAEAIAEAEADVLAMWRTHTSGTMGQLDSRNYRR